MRQQKKFSWKCCKVDFAKQSRPQVWRWTPHVQQKAQVFAARDLFSSSRHGSSSGLVNHNWENISIIMLKPTREQGRCTFPPWSCSRFGCIVGNCIPVGVLSYGVNNVWREQTLENHSHTRDRNWQEKLVKCTTEVARLCWLSLVHKTGRPAWSPISLAGIIWTLTASNIHMKHGQLVYHEHGYKLLPQICLFFCPETYLWSLKVEKTGGNCH